MSYNLILIHPEATVREAAIKTFQPHWPHGQVTAAQTDTLHTDAITLALINGPKRLSHWLYQAEQRLIQLKWPKLIQIGCATLDTATRTWQSDTRTIELTEKEVALLVYLVQARKPISRLTLLQDVWRYAADAETHTIETHIHRLRQKIETDPDNPLFLLTGKEGYYVGSP